MITSLREIFAARNVIYFQLRNEQDSRITSATIACSQPINKKHTYQITQSLCKFDRQRQIGDSTESKALLSDTPDIGRKVLRAGSGDGAPVNFPPIPSHVWEANVGG